jgi:AAA15 family ATPase/GTPase
MIESLHIENFRGIKKLEVSDLKPVNLFVGKNNSGKSTVLESLFLLSGINNERMSQWAQLLQKQHQNRPSNFLESMFHNFDMKQTPVLHLKKPRSDSSTGERLWTKIKISNNPAYTFNIDAEWAEVLNMSRKYDDFKGDSIRIEESEQGLKITPSGHSFLNFQPLPVRWLSAGYPREILSTIFADFSWVQNERIIPKVVSVLKTIEPKVLDLRLAENYSVIVEIDDLRQMISASLLGDGMVRLLAIIIAIVRTKDGIVLIDEVDSGFHTSVLDKVWEIIFESAKEFNVQVFATTHSHECLEAFVKHESTDDDRRLYRLSRRENETHVTAYKREEILASLDMDLEVR